MIKTIKQWLFRIKEYPLLLERFNDSESELNLVMEELKKYKQLEEPYGSYAEYWNTKWKQSVITYSAPKKLKVTEYLAYRQIPEITQLAQQLIREHHLISTLPDKVPLEVLKWLEERFNSLGFRYLPETKEYWDQPEEVMEKKEADCDGYGILEYFLIREIFKQLNCWEIVKHRLKCVDGHVHHPQLFYPYGGRHFYLIWLNGEKQWMTVETTFYRELAIANYGKKAQKDNPIYGTINYTFNEQFSWAHNSLVVERNYEKR